MLSLWEQVVASFKEAKFWHYTTDAETLNDRGDLLIAVFGKILMNKSLLISTLQQMDRLELTDVYRNRRWV